jgi:hypothetical protein
MRELSILCVLLISSSILLLVVVSILLLYQTRFGNLLFDFVCYIDHLDGSLLILRRRVLSREERTYIVIRNSVNYVEGLWRSSGLAE